VTTKELVAHVYVREHRPDAAPGVLPLVQETLVLLWEKLERRVLRNRELRKEHDAQRPRAHDLRGKRFRVVPLHLRDARADGVARL